jgi:hypothetical protein
VWLCLHTMMQHLKSANWEHIDRTDIDYFELGMTKIIRGALGDAEAFVGNVPALIRSIGGDDEAFYLELLRKGHKPLRRSKLMLVGPGRAGKTSLMRRITGQNFREGEESTSGIEVSINSWRQGDEVPSEFQDAVGKELATRIERARNHTPQSQSAEDGSRSRPAQSPPAAGAAPTAVQPERSVLPQACTGGRCTGAGA